MATATYNAHSTAHASERKGIAQRLYNGLLWLAERNPRVQQVEKLQAMSDDELAQRGLKRDDIARHVYRDLFYL